MAKQLSQTTNEKFKMPDLDGDISGWRKEIQADLVKKCLFRIPDSLGLEIDRYRFYRKQAGLTKLNKEETLLHFVKLGLSQIEYPE